MRYIIVAASIFLSIAVAVAGDAPVYNPFPVAEISQLQWESYRQHEIVSARVPAPSSLCCDRETFWSESGDSALRIQLLAIGVVFVVASAACGRPPAPSTTRGAEHSIETTLARQEAALQVLGADDRHERARACLARTTLARPPPLSTNTADGSDPNHRLERQLAVLIAASGVQLSSACNKTDQEVVHAALRWLRGLATESDVLLFADTVVVARAIGLRPDDRNDGMRSSLMFETVEVLKGALQERTLFVVRMMGGPVSGGEYASVSGEPHARPGEAYVVIASHGRYLMEAVAHSADPASPQGSTSAVLTDGPLIPVGRTSAVRWGTTSLAQLRKTLAAQRSRGHSGSGVRSGVDPGEQALRQDALEAARGSGMTEAQALRRGRVSQALGPVAIGLRQRWSARLAGIALLDAPDLHVQVLLAGPGQPWTEMQDVAGQPLPIRYVPGAAATLDELLAVMARDGDRILRTLHGAQGMGIDAREGTISVVVQAEPANHPAHVATAGRLERELNVPIRVEFIEGPLTQGDATGIAEQEVGAGGTGL